MPVIAITSCRKIEDYDLTQPFLPWALGFAYLEVMKFRERNQRAGRLLKRELVEQLMRERQQEPNLQLRLQALEDCLEKLPATDQVLIQQRYQAKVGIEEMVAQSGSSRTFVPGSFSSITPFL